MKKNVLKLVAASLLTIAASTANALVVDSFDNTSTGSTVTNSTGGGNWVNVHYTGTGIYNDSTRLIAGRAGHSNGYSVSVNPTTGVFTGSGGSADGAWINYGTGVKNWFDTQWASQQYGTKPSVSTENQSIALNIAATLTDAIYLNVGSTGQFDVSFFNSGASLLGSSSFNFTSGLNTISLSSISGLTALEALDIDGITILMYGDNSVSEVGFNITPTAAVPEPETYGMMLLGLGLLGFASRRKQV